MMVRRRKTEGVVELRGKKIYIIKSVRGSEREKRTKKKQGRRKRRSLRDPPKKVMSLTSPVDNNTPGRRHACPRPPPAR